MKTSIKLTLVAFAIAIAATACDPAKKATTGSDTTKTDSTATVADSTKKDTSATTPVDSTKKDPVKK
jgi:hypothetical protein